MAEKIKNIWVISSQASNGRFNDYLEREYIASDWQWKRCGFYTYIKRLGRKMIDKNQLVKVRWNSYNKKHYIEKGYVYTKNNEFFEVKLEDLQLNSSAKVKVICDYCGTEFITTYKSYNIGLNREVSKTCCVNCKQKKALEVNLAKFGSPYFMGTDDFKKKVTDTVREKYCVDNVSQLEWVQDKKKKTNLSKFGTEWFVTSEEFKKDCLEKYGVDNPMKSDDCKDKAATTLFENGNVPTSKEEKKFVNLLEEIFGKENCFPSNKVNRYFLDCLLIINGIKIDVEYDGWYWHKDKQDYDNNRNNVLLNKGYKIFRIFTKGKLPTSFQIKESIDKLLNGENIIILYV